ncbi:unnamed protein product [Cylindrotheca closterium]|uniref:GH26 domain-containing protein n=1 Tax=Cylindrotheca closterium TaxID=2856 RepID=A0AAD2G3L4_9STRA|nr:unnamed protein product [Cylindrotheca closterium]
MKKSKPKQPLWQPDTSCRPPPGKTYLTIGQDFFSIEEYLLSQYNASLEDNSMRPLSSFDPAATMFYTDIQELRGLAEPVDYGSGIEYADALQEAFPKSGIQIGLWLNGTAGCEDIVDGALDLQIKEMYKELQKLHVPKVFLRVGYEFDNPWFGYSSDPLVYQQAFQYLVQACEVQLSIPGCHRVVSFVWHSWAAPKVAPLADFYPGDKYVDWVGVSIFQQLYPWANEKANGDFAGGTLAQVQEVLDFARDHDKPIMIAESTPFGGMFFENQPPVDFDDKDDMDIWDLWFQPTLDLIEEYDIGMWSYINCDWNSQPMWAGVGFGDTRISSVPKVMANWRQRVLGNPRFVTNKLDCYSNMHAQYKNHYTPAMGAIGTSGRASVYNLDSFSTILPAILVVGILFILGSTIQRLYCKLRVDEPTESQTKLLLEEEEDPLKTGGYGAVGSNVSSRDEHDNSGRWSVNL